MTKIIMEESYNFGGEGGLPLFIEATPEVRGKWITLKYRTESNLYVEIMKFISPDKRGRQCVGSKVLPGEPLLIFQDYKFTDAEMVDEMLFGEPFMNLEFIEEKRLRSLFYEHVLLALKSQKCSVANMALARAMSDFIILKSAAAIEELIIYGCRCIRQGLDSYKIPNETPRAKYFADRGDGETFWDPKVYFDKRDKPDKSRKQNIIEGFPQLISSLGFESIEYGKPTHNCVAKLRNTLAHTVSIGDLEIRKISNVFKSNNVSMSDFIDIPRFTLGANVEVNGNNIRFSDKEIIDGIDWEKGEPENGFLINEIGLENTFALYRQLSENIEKWINKNCDSALLRGGSASDTGRKDTEGM